MAAKSAASPKSAGYKLATYKSSDGPRAGLIIGEEVFDAAKLIGKPAYATVLGILEDWKSAEGTLKKAAAGAAKSRAKRQPLGKTKLLAPLRFPGTIYCAGANYADHAAAMAAKEGQPAPADPHEQGLKPWHFIKAARTITDSGTAIKISHYAKAMDWEIELAAVIGRPAKDVSKEKALNYVAGYTVANDLSARDRGRRPNMSPTSFFKMDWTKHKTFEGSCPLGPWIVPASDIADPQNLGLKLWVNDELKQDSNTGKMLFTLAEQIEQLSINMTLHPGDLILTGTPSGTGAESDTFLKAGDTVKLWIEKIGEIENKMA
ncbi:MAG TPA: fumarylacetoacetate hydrolase family protein [Xanthobacteraceae bacterium]|jgi:2-keto-4-pentenoate hydratase/2-oxohepta-3-ene-1,7-dioic acid hydratase in catechol pathway|nr:fumarylacetoacetate hydrolase family protein [Xanthobacteraceae bacterium]